MQPDRQTPRFESVAGPMKTPRTATIRLTHAARDVDDDEPITLFHWFREEWGITGQLFDDGSGADITIPWSSIALAYFSE